MERRLLALLWLAFGAGGCLRQDTYPCDEDLQCRVGDRHGRCVNGWCAYPAPMCASGFQFSAHADPGVAEDCVPTGVATGAGTFDDDGTGFDSCEDGCDTPPGPCFDANGTCDAATDQCVYEPSLEGTPCDPGEPCVGDSTCDAMGTCVERAPIMCNEPPSTCHMATGTCDPADGGCTYAVEPAGSDCEDGDACTVGDTCDASGTCTPGPVCETANPCEVANCVAGACEITTEPDGTQCGATAADRCCGGTCVRIDSDTAHCGGCGMACSSAQSCESVGATNTCAPAPVDETGRCTCVANADCPNGQICRTVTPFANRCAPDEAADCPGVFVDVASCPNYCTY